MPMPATVVAVRWVGIGEGVQGQRIIPFDHSGNAYLLGTSMDANWVSAISTFIASCVSLYIALKRYKPDVYVGCSLLSWDENLVFPDGSEIRVTTSNQSRIPLYISSVYFSFRLLRAFDKFRLYHIINHETSGYALVEISSKEILFQVSEIDAAIMVADNLCNINKYALFFLRAYISTTSGETYSAPIGINVWRYICQLKKEECHHG